MARLWPTALRAVSGELRQTLHTAATGLTHCSRDLRYLSVNAAYGRLVGLPVEQIAGTPIVDVLGQAAFKILRPHIERVLHGERVEYQKTNCRSQVSASGFTASMCRTGMPPALWWAGSARSRTSPSASAPSKNSRLPTHSSTPSSKTFPSCCSSRRCQSLRFMRLNRAGEDLLGWPKQTLIGKTDYDFWPKEQAEFFVEKDRETLKSGKIIDIRGRTDTNAPSRHSHPAYEKSSDPRHGRSTRFISSVSRRTSPSESGSKRNSSSWLRLA